MPHRNAQQIPCRSLLGLQIGGNRKQRLKREIREATILEADHDWNPATNLSASQRITPEVSCRFRKPLGRDSGTTGNSLSRSITCAAIATLQLPSAPGDIVRSIWCHNHANEMNCRDDMPHLLTRRRGLRMRGFWGVETSTSTFYWQI